MNNLYEEINNAADNQLCTVRLPVLAWLCTGARRHTREAFALVRLIETRLPDFSGLIPRQSVHEPAYAFWFFHPHQSEL